MNGLNIRRGFHFVLLISVLILFSTAFAAAFLFSKEAILASFENSFNLVGISNVSASDRLLIARLERRETWDWHFWSGVFATVSFIGLMISSIIGKSFTQKRKHYVLLGIPFLILSITGVLMYSRIYIPMEKDFFENLKVLHNLFWQIFIVSFLIHLIIVWIFKLKPALDAFNKERFL